MLNLKAKDTRIIFDTKGYPIVKGDPKSINDTCGRLVLMGICYGFTPEIIEKLEALLIKHEGHDRVIRHPDNPVVSSRDHHSYFYIYRKYTGQKLPNFPWMRGMNQWMKVLKGKNNWYYFWAIPGAYIGNWWLRKCRKWGGIIPEQGNNWWIGRLDNVRNNGWWIQDSITPWQKLWAWIIFQTMPAYALHNKAWQIYVMRKTPKRDTLRKILISRIGISNIMMRLLLGSSVTQEEVDNYPHMTGYRPGVYLDETCRRDIREMDEVESEFNNYEKDLIKYLYNEI